MKKIFLLIPLLILFACSRENSERDVEKILRINFQDGDLPSSHPHIAIDYRMRSLQGALFEGLTRMDYEGKPQPAAAETITISSCKTQYTFKLKEACWSNGAAVTAPQFELAWKKAMAKGSPCRRADLFYLIKNGEKIKKGEAQLEEAGVRALDDHTLFVELEHPAPYFLELVSNPIFSPLADENEEPCLFNGPFIIDQWKKDEYIYLKKNPLYWDVAHVGLDKVEIFFITDPLTTVQLFEKGELDWIGHPFSGLPADMIPSFEKTGLLQSKEVDRIYWLYCNHEAFPFNHPSFRKALSYAIDREGIVEHVLLRQSPARAPLPNALSLLVKEMIPKTADHVLAQSYFNEALEEMGLTKEAFPPITLSHSHITGQRQLAEIIQSNWQQILGIRVNLEGAEWNKFFSDLSYGKYQVGGCLKSALFKDPIYHLELLLDKNHPYNVSRWEDADYKTLLGRATESIDTEERVALLREAEQILLDQMPVIPIYSEVYLYMIRPEFAGVIIHDLGHVDFKTISSQPL